MEMPFELPKERRDEAARALGGCLADTYALYLKTQNFHWNVTGKEFFSLHRLFEKHYEEMAEAVDEIAERIRELGSYVDASFGAFAKRTKLSESKGAVNAKEMLAELLEAHETLSRNARPLVRRFQDFHDEVSADLIIKRLTFHEKASWMLRSQLEY